MLKVLNKRILRDLKENFFRYLALFLLIVLGMYLVISVVGGAESVIHTVSEGVKREKVEDGQFGVFVPLSEEDRDTIEAKGVELEEQFYLDFEGKHNSTIRVFRNRKKINLINISKGQMAEKEDELVLEKRYAQENEITLGDTLVLGDKVFTIVGIGSAPDYDQPMKKMSDTAVDSKNFGTVFVTEEAYDYLKESGQAKQTEEYLYSYRITGDCTEKQLKDTIGDLELDRSRITDQYFLDMVKEAEEDKKETEAGVKDIYNGTKELTDGAQELADGTKELKDGTTDLSDGMSKTADGAKAAAGGSKALAKGSKELEAGAKSLNSGTAQLKKGLASLNKSSSELRKGADAVWNATLVQANETLKSSGCNLTITGTNYRKKLDSAISQYTSVAPKAAQQLKLLKQQLQSIEAFVFGVKSYTKGVDQAYSGSQKVASGADSLYKGAGEVSKGAASLENGLTSLEQGSGSLVSGSQDLVEGAGNLQKGSSALYDATKELEDGVKILKEKTGELLEEYFDIPLKNMTSFVTRDENPRIEGSSNDVITNKNVGLLAGVIILGLFTFVISVFVVHGIEKESSVIGALYALGVTKKHLILHYIKLPVVISFFGGILGVLLAQTPIGIISQTVDTIAYFSIPEISVYCPTYLLVYGLVMPPVIAAVVNILVINSKLSVPALKLLRNEKKVIHGSRISLKGLDFIRTFQVRQLLREMRTAVTLAISMFVCLLILMLALDCYSCCSYIGKSNVEDTKYEYMYSYKYPTKEVPEGGEAVYMESFQKTYLDFDLEVSILGIDKDNPYFQYDLSDSKREIAVSSSAAMKLNLAEGDELVLLDKENDKNYAFTVGKIVPYSVGLYLFMDIDSMRELFEQEEDYYNVVFSDKELNIEKGRLYATTEKEDLKKSSDIFLDLMSSMIIMLSVVSIVIFVVVMYLMMKVMIDRSSFHISLMKIFGFRNREVRKLYLNGNFLVVVVSAVIGIPLAKAAMDAIFPYFIYNVQCGVDLSFKPWLYIVTFVGILLCYFVINRGLTGKLSRIVPAEVLKNRE